jgi:tripartite-type tricarboxylate transporter receptor subunit TctC
MARKIKVELDEEELDYLIEAMKQMRDSDEFMLRQGEEDLEETVEKEDEIIEKLEREEK